MKTAILMPCYNESMTIKKAINDFQRYCLMQISMYMTTIQPMAPMK